MLIDSPFVIIRVSVPLGEADKIRTALGEAGAGKQGAYSHCSGSFQVIGRFTPLEGARPAIGQVGIFEQVEEEVIQTICHKDIVEDVVARVREIHPYEEPSIDILPRLEIA